MLLQALCFTDGKISIQGGEISLFTDKPLASKIQSQIFLAQNANLLTILTFILLKQGFLPIISKEVCPLLFLYALVGNIRPQRKV